jgi:hypothetical protein
MRVRSNDTTSASKALETEGISENAGENQAIIRAWTAGREPDITLRIDVLRQVGVSRAARTFPTIANAGKL